MLFYLFSIWFFILIIAYSTQSIIKIILNLVVLFYLQISLCLTLLHDKFSCCCCCCLFVYFVKKTDFHLFFIFLGCFNEIGSERNGSLIRPKMNASLKIYCRNPEQSDQKCSLFWTDAKRFGHGKCPNFGRIEQNMVRWV